MGDIGDDIKEVIAEIGAAISILRDSGTVSGEYIKISPNTQATKPFIREFFLEAQISYDTLAIVGDVIQLEENGDKFLLMNKSPYIIENDSIRNDIVLYKCNVSGELQRSVGEARDSQYHRTFKWTTVKTVCYGLMTEPLYGNVMEQQEAVAQVGISRHELYIPTSVGVKLNDRYIPVSGECYKVEAVINQRYNGVTVVQLSEDTR